MNIIQILTRKYPGTEWALTENDYATLEWFSDTPKPTEKQLEELQPEVDYEIAYEAVQAKRAGAYSAESDILKYKWEETLDPADHAAFMTAKQAIRERFPYPEKPKDQ